MSTLFASKYCKFWEDQRLNDQPHAEKRLIVTTKVYYTIEYCMILQYFSLEKRECYRVPTVLENPGKSLKIDKFLESPGIFFCSGWQ